MATELPTSPSGCPHPTLSSTTCQSVHKHKNNLPEQRTCPNSRPRFNMYTTPVSTLVSSMSLNHHLYADDTQLFLSFHPSEFHSNITHLQNALQQISSWMTANLLTLSSSKTEFLLIGLKQQLSKIHNSSLTTTDSARHLGFIFDEHLTFSDQISALSLILLLSHSWTSLYPPISRLQNSQHHCHLHCPF